MREKLDILYGKDDIKAYNTLKELEILSTEDNELYNYIDELLEMLKNEKTFVRVRAFRLICHLAKYDNQNKINNNISIILNELDDDTSTSVRGCLNKLNLILLYKPELNEVIINKLNNLDLTKYKESMSSLIERDIKNIINNI